MLRILKHLWLGLALILAASAILLLSDLDRRLSQSGPNQASKPRLPRIAVLQFTSNALLDDSVTGVIEGLRDEGFENGKTAEIWRFNASGDYATGNTMARDIAAGGNDLVITVSTPALQMMAAANKEGRLTHVFGAVTDPYGSGVGITGPEPHQHPPHLLGIGTFQPVVSSFLLAQEMNPALKKVGVVWNPTEQNSEACVQAARQICAKQGIKLVEANAGSSAEVAEAIRSVIARGVDALWVGGDTVATSSIMTIIGAAKGAGIPVFTNDPSDAPRGALFGLGASYLEVGRTIAALSAKVLRGDDPRLLRVDNVVPERLALNEAVLTEHKEQWTATPDHRNRAAAMANVLFTHPRRTPEAGRQYRVAVFQPLPHPLFNQALDGIRSELAAAGFSEGHNLVVRVFHANGDIALLPQVAASIPDFRPDLVIPLSTPALTAASARLRDLPMVFGVVTEPLGAGTGTSYENHLPNLTGAVWPAPLEEGFVWLGRLFPDRKRMGILYNPSEANSRTEILRIRSLCTKLGLQLFERTLSNSSELTEAFNSLLSERIDCLFAMGDTTVLNGLPTLGAACRRARIPMVADDGSMVGTGALLSIGISPQGNGQHTGRLAARVLLGDNPARIPFEVTKEQEFSVDLAVASELGIRLPAALLGEANVFHNLSRSRGGKPASVAMVNLVQTPILEASEAGVLRGLKSAGLSEGTDFVLRKFNAQGEIGQLPAIIDSALATRPDLIITVTTPALIAAAKKVTDIPVVFTVASDPAKLGLFTKGKPANLTGVHDDPPVDKLLDMARRYNPDLGVVGTIYDPAQPNSLISVEKMRIACKNLGIRLFEATASSTPEVPTAAQSIIQKGVGAILVSADNLIHTGFPGILRAARPAGIPIFCTDPMLVDQGATGGIGDDYHAWGIQSGKLAAKVLAGADPIYLPIEATAVQELREPVKRTASAKRAPADAARIWKLRIVAYNETVMSEDCLRGLKDGLAKGGLREGSDFSLRVLNAQGDMVTLSSIMTSVRSDHPDLLMVITTPALQAALRQATGIPTVFTGVGDGVHAGAGKSVTDHLPHVTGITTKSPFEGMAQLLRESLPSAKRVGTLFTPAEINSVLYKEWLAEALKSVGAELVAVPISSSSETAEAAAALSQEKLDVVCQIADNTTRPGFALIVRKAAEAGVPVFCFESSQLKDGAVLALARDYYEAGVEAGELGVRILRGAKPADIPFSNTRSERLLINPVAAAKFSLVFPERVLKRAESYTPPPSESARKRSSH